MLAEFFVFVKREIDDADKKELHKDKWNKYLSAYGVLYDDKNKKTYQKS